MSRLGFNFLPRVGLTMGEVHCILFFRTTKIKYLQLDKSFRKHCRTHSPPPNFTQVHDMPPSPTHTHTHTHTSPNRLSESFHSHRWWKKSRGFILWISYIANFGKCIKSAFRAVTVYQDCINLKWGHLGVWIGYMLIILNLCDVPRGRLHIMS